MAQGLARFLGDHVRGNAVFHSWMGRGSALDCPRHVAYDNKKPLKLERCSHVHVE